MSVVLTFLIFFHTTRTIYKFIEGGLVIYIGSQFIKILAK